MFYIVFCHIRLDSVFPPENFCLSRVLFLFYLFYFLRGGGGGDYTFFMHLKLRARRGLRFGSAFNHRYC